jgi:hypothetical protein
MSRQCSIKSLYIEILGPLLPPAWQGLLKKKLKCKKKKNIRKGEKKVPL